MVVTQTVAGPGAAVGSSAPRADRHTSPKSLVLRLRDVSPLGKGFQESDAVVSNELTAAVERVSVATMNRYRIIGYQSLFGRRVYAGIVSITDSVGLYRSSSAAHWGYLTFTSLNRPLTGSHSLSMRGIGDEAQGFARSTAYYSSASIYFRRGMYNARLDLLGIGPMRDADALQLARVLDARMRAAR